jgi:hypothetical protein
MARRLVTLLVVACFGMFVFAATGCGGDDDSSASDDTTLTETTTTEETTEEETTEEETTEEETTDTTETSASDDFATAENCEEFAQIGAQVSEAITGTADVDEIKAAFDELAAAAPDDIKPDFEVLAEYMAAIAEALGGVDVGAGETPDPSALAKLAQIDAAEATAASTNISRWVTENCTGTTTTP